MTFIGLDLETSARLAGFVAALLAFLAGASGIAAWKWNDQAQTAKDRRALAAEAELADLKRKSAPRQLSQSVYQRLVELLNQAPAQGTVRVGWANNAECAAYGAQLAKALGSTGWTVETTIMVDLNGRGVFVVVEDQETAPAHARSLLQALTEAGIEVTGVADQRFGKGAPVSLLIAERPE